jgi:hypothetical protein
MTRLDRWFAKYERPIWIGIGTILYAASAVGVILHCQHPQNCTVKSTIGLVLIFASLLFFTINYALGTFNPSRSTPTGAQQ